MFDGIADRYDFPHRLVSLGLDGRWQRRLKSKRQLFSRAKGLYIPVPPEYRSWGVIPAEQFIDRLMAHLHRQYLRLAALCSGAARRGAPCATEEALGLTPAGVRLCDVGVGAEDVERERFEDVVGQVDLVFDLVGGEVLERSWSVLKPGGILVSVVENPNESAHARRTDACAVFFVVEAHHGELVELARRIEAGQLRPLESTLAEARARRSYR